MDAYIEELLLHECASKKVLEYGCGKGSSAFMLAGSNAKVTGIDISEVAIEQARQRAQMEGLSEHASFMVMDAENLEFPDNSFDVVCGSGILHHLNIERSLSEIYRVLTPEGKAIFAEPMGHNPFITLYRNMTPDKRTADEHPLLMKDITDAKRVFPVVEEKYFNACTLTLVPFRRTTFFENLLQYTYSIDNFLFSTFPVTRRLAWSVVLIMSKSVTALK
jgi:ubiquinone/menaquinone biosynthesis C-methylase UbiE